MSQKANLQTVRKFVRTINLLTFSPIEFLRGLTFSNYFHDFFRKKNVLVNSLNLNFLGNKAQLTISLFVCTSKIKFLANQITTVKVLKPQLKDQVSNFIFKELNFLGINFLVLKFLLLNKFCLSFKRNLYLKTLFLKLRTFKDVLFARRNSLFFDLLKISFLFTKGLVTSKLFLSLLVQTFKILPKRRHARFLSFIKKVFKILTDEEHKNLINKPSGSLLGLKCLISGKLKGKLRTQRFHIQHGKLALQTISKNIEYSKLHAFTRYGTFGFKIWVFRN